MLLSFFYVQSQGFFSSQTFTEMNWALLPCYLLTLLLLHTERRKLLLAPVSISNKWVSLSPGHETHLNHCLFLMYMCDYLQDYTWKPGCSFRTFPPDAVQKAAMMPWGLPRSVPCQLGTRSCWLSCLNCGKGNGGRKETRGFVPEIFADFFAYHSSFLISHRPRISANEWLCCTNSVLWVQLSSNTFLLHPNTG